MSGGLQDAMIISCTTWN